MAFGATTDEADENTTITIVNQDDEGSYDPVGTGSIYTEPNLPSQIPGSPESNCDIHVQENRERRYGRLIIEGNSDKLKEFLKEENNNGDFLLKLIDTLKVKDVIGERNIQEEIPSRTTAIDLAILVNQRHLIDVIIEHGLENIAHYSDYLRATTFLESSTILHKLIIKSPSAARDFLDVRVDSNHDKSNVSSSEVSLTVDLSVFHRVKNELEGDSISAMLDAGEWTLIEHPVTEMFINLKWSKIRWSFCLGMVYRILLAIVMTLSVLDMVQHGSRTENWRFPIEMKPALRWLPVGLLVPLVFSTLLEVLAKKSRFFVSHWNEIYCTRLLSKHLNSYPCLSMKSMINMVIIISIVMHSYCNLPIRLHFSCLSILFTWLFVFMKIHSCPTAGIYVHILWVSLKDVIKFIAAISSLVLGFTLAFYVLLGQNNILFSNPVKSLLTLIMMSMGHLDVLEDGESIIHDTTYPGTTEATFVLFTVILILGVLNVIISISVANVRDVLDQKEYFALSMMIQNIRKTEKLLQTLSKLLTNFGCTCCSRDTSWLRLLPKKEECVFRLFPLENRSLKSSSIQTLPFRFGKTPEVLLEAKRVISPKPTDDIQLLPTNYFLPLCIWSNAKPIIDELHELLRSRGVNMDGREVPADYTSLYWQPSASETSDYPSYEKIDPDMYTSPHSSNLRDTVMREIRKELARFKGFGDKSGMKSESGKCVNVRPGLALGVIALQAGAPKVLLQNT